MFILRMALYYTVYTSTPFWFGQTHMCKRPSPQPTADACSLLHMTSICCQLPSEACLPTWLNGGTCWVPAVWLLYMAGITPTSCVPLLLEPFMWLQEEKSLVGAVMQRVWTRRWTDLHKHRVGTVVIWVGASVVMEWLLHLVTVAVFTLADSLSTAGAGCTDPRIHGSSPGRAPAWCVQESMYQDNRGKLQRLDQQLSRRCLWPGTHLQLQLGCSDGQPWSLPTGSGHNEAERGAWRTVLCSAVGDVPDHNQQDQQEGYCLCSLQSRWPCWALSQMFWWLKCCLGTTRKKYRGFCLA